VKAPLTPAAKLRSGDSPAENHPERPPAAPNRNVRCPGSPRFGLRAIVGRSVGAGAQNPALTGPAHLPEGFVG
jgi:hypothetical protein